jgi:hypothetical protein
MYLWIRTISSLVLGSRFLVLAILLMACGAARPASADQPAARAQAHPPTQTAASARPRASSAPAPQRAPKPIDAPTLAPTRAPSTPTNAPIRAVVATHTPQPIRAATATPGGIPTQARSAAELRFRAVDPEDHYVAIREQPTSSSREVGRLAPGDEIVCASIVAGETLVYLGRQSNRWASCPSVGGNIFLPLLIPIGDTT